MFINAHIQYKACDIPQWAQWCRVFFETEAISISKYLCYCQWKIAMSTLRCHYYLIINIMVLAHGTTTKCSTHSSQIMITVTGTVHAVWPYLEYLLVSLPQHFLGRLFQNVPNNGGFNPRGINYQRVTLNVNYLQRLWSTKYVYFYIQHSRRRDLCLTHFNRHVPLLNCWSV